MPHIVRNLHLVVQDMNTIPVQPTLAKKQLNEVVANTLPPGSTASQDSSIAGMGNVITVGDYDLQLSGTSVS